MTEDQSLTDVIEAYVNKGIADIHTITVGRVERVNEKTIDVQPVINKTLKGNTIKNPVLKDVPPIFLQGGSSSDVMPITVGDYCLLLISEACYDRWYNGQDNIEPLEDRLHDYSDAFALVGVNPYAKAINIPSVRTITGDIEMTGDLNIIGTISVIGDIILNGRALDAYVNGHTHEGSPNRPPNPSP